MATIEQLQDALLQAHRTGDKQSAQILADEIRKMSEPSFAGTADAFGNGVLKGVISLLSAPVELGMLGGEYIGRGIDWATGASPETKAKHEAQYRATREGMPFTTANMQPQLEKITGPLAKPHNRVERYAETLGEWVPGMAFGPGSAGQKVGATLGGALTSEAAGQATEGSYLEPVARFAGGMLGSSTPSIIARSITPNPVNPTRARNIETVRRENIPVTAGQATGNKRLAYLESELGGRATDRITDAQNEQFTRAASSRAGLDAPRLTTEVMGQAFDEIGQRFNRLAATTDIPVDMQLQDDLLNAVTRYQDAAGTVAAGPERLMNRIGQLAGHNSGVISGEAYQSITTDLRRLYEANPQLGGVVREMRNALDDAIERNISPDLRDAWRETRSQYRHLLVLEDAMVNGTEKSAEGLMNPYNLGGSIRKIEGKRARSTGRSDFSDLATAGQNLLKPLPNSGTAARGKAQALGAGLLGALGGTGGTLAYGLPGGAAGLSAGFALPYAAGRLLMSRPAQSYLMNQLLPAEGLSAGGKLALTAMGTGPKIKDYIVKKLEQNNVP